jgi:hypothetical protein
VLCTHHRLIIPLLTWYQETRGRSIPSASAAAASRLRRRARANPGRAAGCALARHPEATLRRPSSRRAAPPLLLHPTTRPPPLHRNLVARPRATPRPPPLPPPNGQAAVSPPKSSRQDTCDAQAAASASTRRPGRRLSAEIVSPLPPPVHGRFPDHLPDRRCRQGQAADPGGDSGSSRRRPPGRPKG